MDNQDIPKSEIIEQIYEWLYRIGAMRAGLELQIWGKIATGADTVKKIALQEGWNATGIRALLDTICALKLLSRQGECYSLVPEAAHYLTPGKSTYKGGIIQHEINWEGNGKLAQAIRNGKRPVAYDATTPEEVDLWIADYSRRWVYPEYYFNSDANLWHTLEINAFDGLQVLDLACGPAPISLALARQHPGVRLTWVDWDTVLQTAINLAAGLGIDHQVVLLPGDLWSVGLSSSTFNTAYLGNVTHFFNPEQNTELFCKVHAALLPGGSLVVNSVARRESEGAASVALWLYAATSSGSTYSFSEYKSMLENAGFTDVRDYNLGPIKAVKP
jgi:ubiquinone/menaquinone biosynthesis C-methylase UbiE